MPFLNRYLLYVPTLLAWPTAGALIAVRQPRNAIGWLLLVNGVLTSLGGVAEGYWRYALFVQPGALPGGQAMLWLNVRPYEISVACEALLILLFPTGRMLSPRWWLAGGAVMLGVLLRLIALALMPGPLDPNVTIDNPVGLAGASAALATIAGLGTVLIAGGDLAAVVSLILRFRRARGIERQQIKVLAYVLTPYLLSTVVITALVQGPGAALSPLANLGIFAQAAAGALVAGGIAVAMWRYRLFDIDVIINRTIVYTLLSGLLVAAYLASVVLLQQMFRVLVGQESDLTIVASTLFIAVLFQPLRRRVQTFIDRRFYRRSYDAGAILAAHSAVLRDEVDQQRITGELLGVVGETLHPVHASLWLRDTVEERR
jgi:hypothetical protein